jgi:hypothetical protein
MERQVEPAKPRARMSDEPGGLRVVMRPRLSFWHTAFPLLFLGFWTWSALGLRGDSASSQLGALGIWLFGMLFVGTPLLWTLAGRETATAGISALELRHSVGPLGITRRYERSSVRDLRAERVSDKAPGWNPFARTPPGGAGLAFDYGSSTVRFGTGIDDAEAKEIARRLGERL